MSPSAPGTSRAAVTSTFALPEPHPGPVEDVGRHPPQAMLRVLIWRWREMTQDKQCILDRGRTHAARPEAQPVSPRSPRPGRADERRAGRLLVPVAGAAAAAVSWLADSAREHDGPSRIDPTTASRVLGIRTPTLTDVAQALTFVGSEVSVGLLAVIVFAVLVVRRELDRAAVVAVGIGGSAFLTVTIKLLVARTRPGRVDRLGALDTSYSFPSGHTLNSAVFIALAVWLLWPVASQVARYLLVAGGGLLAVGVAASRVYLGYHWLTDVIASALVAVAWLSIVALLRGWVQRRMSRVTRPVAQLPGTPETTRLE